MCLKERDSFSTWSKKILDLPRHYIFTDKDDKRIGKKIACCLKESLTKRKVRLLGFWCNNKSKKLRNFLLEQGQIFLHVESPFQFLSFVT
jgi:hypothetical protein